MAEDELAVVPTHVGNQPTRQRSSSQVWTREGVLLLIDANDAAPLLNALRLYIGDMQFAAHVNPRATIAYTRRPMLRPAQPEADDQEAAWPLQDALHWLVSEADVPAFLDALELRNVAAVFIDYVPADGVAEEELDQVLADAAVEEQLANEDAHQHHDAQPDNEDEDQHHDDQQVVDDLRDAALNRQDADQLPDQEEEKHRDIGVGPLRISLNINKKNALMSPKKPSPSPRINKRVFNKQRDAYGYQYDRFIDNIGLADDDVENEFADQGIRFGNAHQSQERASKALKAQIALAALKRLTLKFDGSGDVYVLLKRFTTFADTHGLDYDVQAQLLVGTIITGRAAEALEIRLHRHLDLPMAASIVFTATTRR